MSEPTLHEQLTRLGFRLPESTFDAVMKDAIRAKRAPRELVEALAEAERRARHDRQLERRQRQAMLGTFRTLDEFDWAHPRSIDRVLYEDLLSMDFVACHINVLFRGAVGLGKTTLAKNLGQRALQSGYSVRFVTLAGMLADISRPDAPVLQQRRMRRYTQPDLLIIDEIGYVPFDARSGDVFYNVIAERHEKASTIATTNLPFKAWGSVLGDAASVIALIDRFSENLHVLDIEGDSARASRRDPKASSSPRRKKSRR